MIRVYVDKKSIQIENGTTITTHIQIVKSANQRKVTAGLIKALRSAGVNPALGEEIYIKICDYGYV